MEKLRFFFSEGFKSLHISLFLFIWHRGLFCGNCMERALDCLLRLVQRLMMKMVLHLYSLSTFIHVFINTQNCHCPHH